MGGEVAAPAPDVVAALGGRVGADDLRRLAGETDGRVDVAVVFGAHGCISAVLRAALTAKRAGDEVGQATLV